MRWEDVPTPPPGPGEVLVRHTAVGLNFVDTYFRSGLYPLPLPFVPGASAAGVVAALGPGAGHVRVGDRVAYIGSTGAYSQERVIGAGALVRLPDDIDDAVGAACLLQGLTARLLLKDVYPVQAGEPVLVHAAAGGVGGMLSQWASAIGAVVIGTVSSEAKADIARGNGCAHVIVLRGMDEFASRVAALGGAKPGVVYDAIGRDTFARSLDCLRPRGLMVVYGQSSGTIDPLEINLLGRKGSLRLTRPMLPDFMATREQFESTSAEFFAAVRAGLLRPVIAQRRPLAEAAEAHGDIEARRTTGSTVFTVPA
jgi:NADPH:quinone reductase